MQPTGSSTPQPAQYSHLLDSLSANEFFVEIDGQKAPGIVAVQGLTSFRLDLDSGSTAPLRDPLRILKLVQRDPNLPFSQWIRETIASRTDTVRPTRTLAVVALDDGTETRRWTVKGAYITAIHYSDFDTGTSQLVQETLVVQYDDIEETWSWSG